VSAITATAIATAKRMLETPACTIRAGVAAPSGALGGEPGAEFVGKLFIG
jgi:hypothetical protein